MGRFETEVLTQPGNLAVLTKLSGKWIDRLRERKPRRELILDLDSSVSETHGAQEGTAYNGHFGCTCYHPLFCFNQFGDKSPLCQRKTERRLEKVLANLWRGKKITKKPHAVSGQRPYGKSQLTL